MPKNRKRTKQPGAKSIAIRTKHKIGGRKLGRGVKQISTKELHEIFLRCRPRDNSKLLREINKRPALAEPVNIL